MTRRHDRALPGESREFVLRKIHRTLRSDVCKTLDTCLEPFDHAGMGFRSKSLCVHRERARIADNSRNEKLATRGMDNVAGMFGHCIS